MRSSPVEEWGCGRAPGGGLHWRKESPGQERWWLATLLLVNQAMQWCQGKGDDEDDDGGGDDGWGESAEEEVVSTCFDEKLCWYVFLSGNVLAALWLPVFVSFRWQAEGRPNQSPTVSFYQENQKYCRQGSERTCCGRPLNLLEKQK